MPPPSPTAAGVGFAVAAYSIWGFVPIYWKWVGAVPASEVLIPRILWTALLMLGALWGTGRMSELRDGLTRRRLLISGCAAVFLAINWLTFVYAVLSDQIVATSLGYYINPLVSVLLAVIFLRERLSAAQAGAVALAGVGVGIMTVASGSLPWIAVVLALSFGLYGLVHKLAPQPPLAGLALEMLLLTPVMLGYGLWLVVRGESALIDAPLGLHAQVSLVGLLTAGPLLCFHAAARRLPLALVGMFQYLAPSLSLVLAVVLYDEPFTGSQVAGFGCVWGALLIFSLAPLLRTSAPIRSSPVR